MYSRWLNYLRFLYLGKIFVPIDKEDIANLLTLVTRKPKDFTPYYQSEKIPNLYKFNGIVDPNRFTISIETNAPLFFIPKIKGLLTKVENGTLISLTGTLFFSSKIVLLCGICTMLFICFFLVNSNQDSYAIVLSIFYLTGYFVGILDFRSNVKKTIVRIKKEIDLN